MKNSMKVAFCGVMAALGVVVMFLAGVIPTVTIALPALAGCFMIPVVAELGKRWGFGVYVTVSVLSFLLVPDREASLFYILFFGYYPVLIAVLGRVKNKVLRWAAKLLVFNAAMLLEVLLSIYVLGIPWENMGPLGQWTPLVLLALANLVLVLYDRLLESLIVLYLRKVHDRVKKLFRL